MASVVRIDGRPWSASEDGWREAREEVTRRVDRWQRRRALETVLWPAAALVLALAAMALMLSGRAAAPGLAAVSLGLVAWRVVATWGRR